MALFVAQRSTALASSFDGRVSELRGRGIERGVHAFLGFWALHAVEKIVEFGAEVIESTQSVLAPAIRTPRRRPARPWAYRGA